MDRKNASAWALASYYISKGELMLLANRLRHNSLADGSELVLLGDRISKHLPIHSVQVLLSGSGLVSFGSNASWKHRPTSCGCVFHFIPAGVVSHFRQGGARANRRNFIDREQSSRTRKGRG